MALDINYFVFNGQDSRDFGIWITAGGLGVFNGSAADVTSTSVAGRDGDVIISNKRRGNKPVPYSFALNPPGGMTLGEAAERVRNWLQADDAYHVLRDSYNPWRYAEAAYLEAFTISDIALKAGTGTINFSARPRLYHDTYPITGTGSVKLINPTGFVSKPVIRLDSVSGKVSLLFQSDAEGSKTYTFGEEGKTYQNVVINCENMLIYEDKTVPTNLFSVCDFPLEFPTLPAGVTTLTVSGNPSITVEPRWYSR